MIRFIIWDPTTNLYVSECVPEKNTLSLTSDKQKADNYMQDDAQLIMGYVNDFTGLKFESLQI